MPCLDGGPSEPAQPQVNFQKALCAALTFIEQHYRLPPGHFPHDYTPLDVFFKATDWKEAGITKEQVASWWAAHKIEDARRHQKEHDEREQVKIRKQALSKLTAAERKALGL